MKEAQTPRKARVLTGLTPQNFGFLGWSFNSQWHLKPPHYPAEYRDISVHEIAQRIRSDLDELVSRAYAIYGDDPRAHSKPLNWGTWEMDCRELIERQCQFASKETVETLSPGLWDKLNSKVESVSVAAKCRLGALMMARLGAEPKEAAKALAYLAVHATHSLQFLSHERWELVRGAAKSSEHWPVTLGFTHKQTAGRPSPSVTGLDDAREYVMAMGPNSPCTMSEPPKPPAFNGSPFHEVAKCLHQSLSMVRQHPQFYFVELSEWAKQVSKLREPMTRANWRDWWKMAKVFLDEAWEIKRQMFAPLISYLRLADTNYKPSLVKRRVIDDSLKKAFRSLAALELQ